MTVKQAKQKIEDIVNSINDFLNSLEIENEEDKVLYQQMSDLAKGYKELGKELPKNFEKISEE